MAYDANLIKTTNTGMSNVIPTPLVNDMIRDIREKSVYGILSSLGIFKDFSGMWNANGGKTIDLPSVADITMASDVAEGVVTPIVGATPDGLQIIVKGVGNAIQYTVESKEDLISAFNNSFRSLLTDSFSSKLSTDVITELNTTTKIVYALKSDDSEYDSTDIDEDAKLSYKTLLKVKSEMHLAKPKVFLVSSACAASLLVEGMVNNKLLSPSQVNSGVIGTLLGAYVIENDYITTVEEGASGSEVDVYQNFAIAEKSVGFAWKHNLSLDIQKDAIVQRSFTFAGFMRYGQEILNVAKIYKVKAVGHFL